MARDPLDKSLKEIQKFESAGFAKSSHVLLNYMRKKNDSNIRIFRPGIGRSGAYVRTDIFGNRFFVHIYDVRSKKKFVGYLVNIFLTNNPDPDINIRKAFTHMLHNNGLHWEQCSCINKEDDCKDVCRDETKEVFVDGRRMENGI